MSIYRIDPVGGGRGFKVQVADAAGGLRVVGVFLTVADADAWIAVDSSRTKQPAEGHAPLVSGREP